MTDTGAAGTVASTNSPQSLHRDAMVQLEKSVEHHRQAALCHEAGDARQAAKHGTMAFDRAAHAVEISGRAMYVPPEMRRLHRTPKPVTWASRVLVVAKKMWRGSSLD